MIAYDGKGLAGACIETVAGCHGHSEVDLSGQGKENNLFVVFESAPREPTEVEVTGVNRLSEDVPSKNSGKPEVRGWCK
jgi:hypothetical protein